MQFARQTIRTITTARETKFDVFAETDHFIMCYEPRNSDTPAQALLDFEDMAQQGYWLSSCGFGGWLIFAKQCAAVPAGNGSA